jgi:hypothetical protein
MTVKQFPSSVLNYNGKELLQAFTTYCGYGFLQTRKICSIFITPINIWNFIMMLHTVSNQEMHLLAGFSSLGLIICLYVRKLHILGQTVQTSRLQTQIFTTLITAICYLDFIHHPYVF